MSTHLNTRCVHNHIVWNSVSLTDGHKYRSNEKSYYTQVRRISDELCRKYGLSLIQPGRTGQPGRPYAQWQAEREGKPTWKTPLQRDVDEAIDRSLTWRQFVREMEGRGYTFRFDRKYPTLTPPGWQRPVRLKTLGWNYTPEGIQRRILAPKPTPLGRTGGTAATAHCPSPCGGCGRCTTPTSTKWGLSHESPEKSATPSGRTSAA